MFDYSCLWHGFFAFFIPGAWAIILYPFFRFYRKHWRTMIIFAICFSFVSMYVKEKFDPIISVNDITADLLGVYFGTALVAAIFSIRDRRISKRVLLFDQRISLRDFLVLACKIEERAVVFYDNAARQLSDNRAKALCLQISFDERNHVNAIDTMLGLWLPKGHDPDLNGWVDKEIQRQNIFTANLVNDVSPKEVLQYAIEEQRKIGDFYLASKDVFSHAWKRDQVQMLVDAERSHESELRDLLQRFFPS